MGKTWKGELCNRAKDGPFYWVNSTITPFLSEDGKIERYISVRFDITKQKEQYILLQEQANWLRITSRHLQLAKASAEKALEDLGRSNDNSVEASFIADSEKMASLEQLTEGLAHELNNPVNFMVAGVASLKLSFDEVSTLLKYYDDLDISNDKATLKAKIEQYKKEIELDNLIIEWTRTFREINIGAARTVQIIKGLRTFSGVDVTAKSKYYLHEGIADTINLLTERLEAKVNLFYDFDKNIKLLNCNPGQINQVILNLILNAEYAIPKGGNITISTKNYKLGVLLSIEDTGVGMNQQTLDQALNPFFTTKVVGAGIGMGLSISHGIVKAHKGTIEIESKENHGTKVLVFLPYN